MDVWVWTKRPEKMNPQRAMAIPGQNSPSWLGSLVMKMGSHISAIEDTEARSDPNLCFRSIRKSSLILDPK